ncbi:glycoside hydrolase family 88 protein, partial [Enterococcus lactis]|nr:glycoside hydrolase family 88 protein [Enterococcus lactis]MCA6754254.1 glycoside hydrolase family 88 protein [Enterococcus lactis]MCA6762436.1 glycoside hydrolase family 88 protein [Enterococcus lactis]MCA6764938.1 glycoside hydrolase family 88 protein [Enterococcus lactis]MCA6770147.1 glycoside hydrolase family 88 protein [Enterococcus lactis]
TTSLPRSKIFYERGFIWCALILSLSFMSYFSYTFYLTNRRKEGWLNLNKNCQVAGLGGAEQRDGSYAYYISEPIICNDQKGVGAFLQALIEVEAL